MQIGGNYDPNAPVDGVLLPLGMRTWRVVDARDYVASSGRTVWEFKCETVFEDATVRRTFRITLDTPYTEKQVMRFIDACGTDPNTLAGKDLQPHNFRGKTFRAPTTHREYQGRPVDDIGTPEPGFYARQPGDHDPNAAPPTRAGQASAQAAADDIPF